MATTHWRSLCERYPQHTLIRNPADYADVFEAIDKAAERARTVEPSADEDEVVGTFSGEDPAQIAPTGELEKGDATVRLAGTC